MLIPAEALRKAREGGWHECRGFQFTRALRGPGGHSGANSARNRPAYDQEGLAGSGRT
jgi:hypothetical protein